MKAADSWITYRTRFLVKAKQLTATLTFTDALGREHSGQKGDYLVEFSDGVRRIASRQIFEDIYVPIMTDRFHTPTPSRISLKRSPLPQDRQSQTSGPLGPVHFPGQFARRPQSYRNSSYPLAGST